MLREAWDREQGEQQKYRKVSALWCRVEKSRLLLFSQPKVENHWKKIPLFAFEYFRCLDETKATSSGWRSHFYNVGL